MSPKIKNIIIIVSVAGLLIFVYFYFFNKKDSAALIPSTGGVLPVTSSAPSEASSVGKDFLTILLNIKNIKIEDSIFSDESFNNLHDSSLELDLTPNKNDEGRPNPFAPVGTDMSASVIPSIDDTTSLDINNTLNTNIIIPSKNILTPNVSSSSILDENTNNTAKKN